MTSAPRDPAWWDARYASKESLWGSGPNRFVAEAFTAAPTWGNGKALDVACGEGRNAVWLAEQGWDAAGVDFSPLALERASALAAERGVHVRWVQADLSAWEADERYALIVVAYLQLPRDELQNLWRRLVRALEPGGELFLIGHARRNLTAGTGGPRDAAVLWEPDELAADLRAADLEVSLSEEILRPVEGARGAIDARLRARRPGASADA
jgi:SAM-dependent methyltransferase